MPSTPPSASTSSRLRVAVLGYIVRGPVGGMAWHHLQYVLGLHRLGHEVLFIEDSGDSEWCCYDPIRGVTDTDPTYGLHFAGDAFARVGLAGRWAYWDQHTRRWLGPRATDAVAWCRDADVVLNISGINPLRDWTASIPHRVLIDTDPVFTQIRHLTEPAPKATAAAHTAFFTFGENFGRPGCTIPDDGLPWRATRQPVVADVWSFTPPPREGSFTTVMQWESYAAREYGGVGYGMKSQSFAPYRDLPRHTAARLELALGGKDAPRDDLRAGGWSIVNPLEVALSPWDYQRYIQQSAGEFGVAKHGYVSSRSGWFSERTAAYLASGRPAVVQDTGFGTTLPTGRGLLAFSSHDEAVAALNEVVGNLAMHAPAARELAVAHFSAGQVLRDLLASALGS